MRTLSTVVGVLITATSASATVLTFDSRADFELATGASVVGAIPLSGSTVEFSIDFLDFKNAGGGSTLNASRNWSTLISEASDLAINGPENFNVESSVPLFAFGFDFHEPTAPRPPESPDTCNLDECVDSTFELRLFDGLSPVAVYEFTRAKDSLEFVGIWTSDPFDRIEVHETIGTADNEFFGNFTTGTTPAPAPASVALLGLGLTLLASRPKRRA
jgi:hypothetical protein